MIDTIDVLDLLLQNGSEVTYKVFTHLSKVNSAGWLKMGTWYPNISY